MPDPRAMDAFIAEKVMGWKFDTVKRVWLCEPHPEMPTVPIGRLEPWHFSIDPAASREMLAKVAREKRDAILDELGKSSVSSRPRDWYWELLNMPLPVIALAVAKAYGMEG